MDNNIDIMIPTLLTKNGLAGGERRDGYLKLVIKSIDKFTTYPYKIYIICYIRHKDEQILFDELKEYYKSRDDINIFESDNKDKSLEYTSTEKENFTKIDGRKVGQGSVNKTEALKTAIRKSDGKYICFVDTDCSFLNEWTEMIIPLVNKYFFVSAMWRSDLNMARDQFFIYEREKFEKENLVPDLTIGDCGGNCTHHAKAYDLEFYICKNSSPSDKIHGDTSLRRQHLLNLDRGEQMWIDDVPFLYHYNRGASKTEYEFNLWIDEVNKYLDNYKGNANTKLEKAWWNG